MKSNLIKKCGELFEGEITIYESAGRIFIDAFIENTSYVCNKKKNSSSSNKKKNIYNKKEK